MPISKTVNPAYQGEQVSFQALAETVIERLKSREFYVIFLPASRQKLIAAIEQEYSSKGRQDDFEMALSITNLGRFVIIVARRTGLPAFKLRNLLSTYGVARPSESQILSGLPLVDCNAGCSQFAAKILQARTVPSRSPGRPDLALRG